MSRLLFLRAGRVTIGVVPNFLEGTFISWVIRDQDFGKVENILKETVSFNDIKGGIPKKCVRVETGVKGKKIREYRFQGRRITDGLILIRGIRLLFHRHLRMGALKITVQKNDVAGNVEPVGVELLSRPGRRQLVKA